MTKTLYIIAGCNGAGKTTASVTMLPEIWQCKEFVNADEIARGLSPYNPEGVAFQAGRIMLQRIEELLKSGATFSIETTLATRTYVSLIRRAKALGYETNLLFFWLPSAEMACERVAMRVQEGGHNIPTDVVIRRYGRGVSNFFELYKDEVDQWTLVDNSTEPRSIVADTDNVYDSEKYKLIQNHVS